MSSKIIIDVRSPIEFACGNVAGSINIPLQEIPLRINEIKEMTSPVILCCASGARSENARQYLSGNGVKCENGGSWMDVEYELQLIEIK